jgi:hypothetical protein
MGKVTFKNWAKPDDPIYREAFLSVGARQTIQQSGENASAALEAERLSEVGAGCGVNPDVASSTVNPGDSPGTLDESR